VREAPFWGTDEVARARITMSGRIFCLYPYFDLQLSDEGFKNGVVRQKTTLPKQARTAPLQWLSGK
jgi:hypothetical protein